MNDRKQLRYARLAALLKLEQLETVCNGCEFKNSGFKYCEPCDNYAKIRQIGKAMEGESIVKKKNAEIQKRNESILNELLAGEKPVKLAEKYNVSAASVHRIRYLNKDQFEGGNEPVEVIREKEIVKPVHKKHYPKESVEVKQVSEEIQKVINEFSPAIESDEITAYKEKIESLEGEKSRMYDEYTAHIERMSVELEEYKKAIRDKNQRIEQLEDAKESDELQKAYDDYLEEREKCKALQAQVDRFNHLQDLSLLLMRNTVALVDQSQERL